MRYLLAILLPPLAVFFMRQTSPDHSQHYTDAGILDSWSNPCAVHRPQPPGGQTQQRADCSDQGHQARLNSIFIHSRDLP